ncbi:hypothetical protein ACOME3_009130 [Neoechinorhynchus agilis]
MQLLLVVSLLINTVQGLVEELYCGNENCYDVLGVPRNATKSLISRTFRKLVQTTHPDRAKSEEERYKLTHKFQRFNKAYETLKNDKFRSDYDSYLEDPSAYYTSYYRYHRRRLVPLLDLKAVILGIIAVMTIIQHYVQHSNYNYKIRNLSAIPKYRHQAEVIAKKQGLLNDDNLRKRNKKWIKSTTRDSKTDDVLMQIIAEQIAVEMIDKPTWKDLLVFRMVVVPLKHIRLLVLKAFWIMRHKIMRFPLNDDEKLDLIRNRLGLNRSTFETKFGRRFGELLKLDLYKWNNFEKWHLQEKSDEERLLLQSASAKRIRRWTKSNAKNHIKFDQEC